jgi:uncharacterized protein (TIGR02598 family)
MKALLGVRRMKPGIQAFSLVEVVLALGICIFVLVTIMGLYSTGLRINRESEDQIQAANFASMIISARRASPLSQILTAIPSFAMTNAFANAYANGSQLTNYVGEDGQLTATAANASYIISCRAGTNTLTGANLAQVYLKLSWPVQANPTNASSDHYEVTTYIPLP